MKTVFKRKGVQKVTAVLLSALIMLSAFAMLPADLFKASAAVVDDERYELDFNNNWKFNLGDVANAQQNGFDDTAWETVELPHDFSISQDYFSGNVDAESGNLPGGTGWYRKIFSMPAEFNGKSIIINFDGAYKDTWVYVNGTLVGENHYGYNSFSIDISEYLTCNGNAANFIAVKVENEFPSSRWYSGSGIYRDVTLTVVDKLHVDLYGTHITTPNLEDSNGTDGTVNAKVTLVNDTTSRDVTVKAEILDANGTVVGTAATQDVTAAANGKTEVTLTPSLQNPTLWNSWDKGTPYLYKLRVTVLENNTPIDIYDTDFGFRWIDWDVNNGFYLNGNAVKLQGVCIHHDQGALGSVQVYDAIYRQISILKDMGCNAIRTSHATASRVFMDVCNELGMLVMAEFFDGWDAPKNSNSNDFSAYFNQTMGSTNLINGSSTQKWYQFVLKQSVMRDRNDPSIVIWDVGNELGEGTNGVSETNFAAYALDMRTMLDELDTTRPICQGNNQRNISSGWAGAVDQYMTVIGGNYQPATWENMESEIKSDVDEVTGKVGKPFVYTEAASAINSRGHYSNSYNTFDTSSTYASDGYQINAYDTSRVGWGTEASKSWYYTITNDWFSGEYIWTGFDYLGEPTPHNNVTTTKGSGYPNSSYFGIIDTAGFGKDSYYLYRSWWNDTDTTLHLVPGTWDSGEVYVDGSGYVDVAVYSNADKIELYANGTKIAESVATTTTTSAGHSYKTWAETATNSSYCNTTEFYTETGKDFYSQFHVRYSSVSELSVKAYEKQSNGTYTEIAETVGTNKVSAVNTTNIVASTWAPAAQTYTADGDSYIYVEYEAQDANGNFDNDYNGTLNIEVQGDSATIVGVDNGKNTDTKRLQQSSALLSDTTATVDMFNGRALVILRTNTTVDEVEVVTTAADGKSVNGVTASVVAETGDELTDEFEEITDQTNVVYEPTLTDRYNDINDQLSAFGGGSVGETEYIYYAAGGAGDSGSVDLMGSTDINSFSDGWYIVYGAGWSNVSQGAMTHEVVNTGLRTDDAAYSSANLPSIDTDAWYFEQQGNGKFHIYYEQDNGTKQYLQISSSSLSVSTTPQELTVSVSTSGVTISNSDSSYYVDYSGNEAYANTASVWQSGTTLTLFKVTRPTTSTPSGAPIENGVYVIYNNDSRYDGAPGILGSTIDSIGIQSVKHLPSGNVITTDAENAYTFTLVDGTTDKYYVRNSSGKYLTIGSSGGSISFSDSANYVSVHARSDGSINIYNADSLQFLDHYWNGTSQDHYSTWSSTTTSSEVNRIFKLYKDENAVVGGGTVPENKTELFNTLNTGLEYAPGGYTNRSYTDFIEAMEAGLAILNSSAADETMITNATTAINEAIAGLETYRKTLPMTLYKYGYNPNSNTPYATGGYAFNAQTYASMEAKIKADTNLVNQIKTIIGYDDETIAWGDDTYKEAALDAAIEKYARFYSLAFTGQPVKGTGAADDFEKTAWNVWIKDNTQGANDSNDEGASVQGLFSAIRQDGQPVDHAPYASLPYGNVSSERAAFNTGDGIEFTYTIANGQTREIENLPALEDISVHINDMFKKEDVLVNPDDESQGYAKYYWDMDFPLMTTTNEYGVNTYSYDSANDSYIFQATYDDANHRATAALNPVEDWSVQLSGDKGNGKGFFPFNYQNGATPPTGSTGTTGTENAIYHYALNFNMDFHVPTTGHYGDGQDIIFDFNGDDDVLVYIDDVLVLDNGGLHAARGASINFTEASVSYQFAMDVTEGVVKDPNGVLSDNDTSNDGELENSLTYAYGEANEGISADNLAAIQKLDEVRNGGGYHTLSFYFIERGSTDSNFKVELNVQEISSNIQLENQTYAVDFGLPVDFNTRANDIVSQEALDDGMDVQYLGITDGNTNVGDVHVFNEPTDVTQTFVGPMTMHNVNGMKYGDCTFNARGAGTYTLNTMDFTGTDYFHNVAKVGNDPTYNEGIDYYVYERVRFIPASTIYFEDTFGGITYTNGTGNAVWETVGDTSLFEDAVQAADSITATDSNPFGYDPVYDNCTTYSGHSAQKVTVSSTDNNPTVKFSFTGTGFDVISLTDSTGGAFAVEIFDDENYTNRVGKRKVVNTYYGYGFGQLYADANGEATLTETDSPLFKSTENEATRLTPTYYSVDGATIVDTPTYYAVSGGYTETVTYLDASGTGYTETATYYDADGNLTTEVTETPAYAYAYAYAYGWIDSDDANIEGIYQVPVIKVDDLAYGKYYVKITPTYSSMHDVKGNGYYTFYMDAIRVYNPAGVGDDAGIDVTYGYTYTNEGYPAYLQMKEMLVGADSLGVNETQGVIFIDGIAALNNDLETYKKAGPNNELYLAKGQAVAFEVWATGIPDSVQIGASSAQGTATFGVTYGENSGEKVLNTSTEMYYDVNDLLPVGGKLTWTRTTVGDTTYYKTNTIVLQNNSATDSIMSISNVKWTFTGVGQNGHFKVNDVPVEVSFMAKESTVSNAYTMLAPVTEVEPDVDTTPDVDADVTVLTIIQRIIRFFKNIFAKIFS